MNDLTTPEVINISKLVYTKTLRYAAYTNGSSLHTLVAVAGKSKCGRQTDAFSKADNHNVPNPNYQCVPECKVGRATLGFDRRY